MPQIYYMNKCLFKENVVLYPRIEEKSAHLLYLIIKDHPFTDAINELPHFYLFIFWIKMITFIKKAGKKRLMIVPLYYELCLLQSAIQKKKM